MNSFESLQCTCSCKTLINFSWFLKLELKVESQNGKNTIKTWRFKWNLLLTTFSSKVFSLSNVSNVPSVFFNFYLFNFISNSSEIWYQSILECYKITKRRTISLYPVEFPYIQWNSLVFFLFKVFHSEIEMEFWIWSWN